MLYIALQVELSLNQNKISIYKFPKNPEEKKRWSDAILRADFFVYDYTAVCQLHWPDDAPF